LPRRWLLPAALATVYVVWGSTYLAIRVMVETMPPLLTAGVRFALAGGIYLTVLRVFGGAGRVRVSRRQLAAAGLVGVLLPFGGNGLVTVAEQAIPSHLAALIIGAVPLIVVLLRLAHGESVGRVTLLGVAVGFAGLAVLVLPGGRPGNAPLWGVLVCLGAAVSWAAGSFYSSRLPLPDDAFAATAYEMLIGGLAMAATGLVAGEAGDVHFSKFSSDSLLALAYLIFIGSLLAYTAYVWLLKNAPISTVATYAFVNPVIAIFLGWTILSEEVSLTTIVGAAAIVASVAAVVRREGGEAPEGDRLDAVGEPVPAHKPHEVRAGD
jgi:drug/metabolite transporter (DMT)-like permease